MTTAPSGPGRPLAPGPEPMTEDELLQGITDALTIAGWRWTHIRRSDGVTMGSPGLPDIIAVHPHWNLCLAWELKSERGHLTQDQFGWQLGLSGLHGVDARTIRPSMYDDALRVIVGGERPAMVWIG